MTRTPSPRDAGFALPLTIFVLTLVTIMLAATMVQVQADRRIAQSSGDVVEALVIAQAGLERYMSHYDSSSIRPPDGDSLRINLTGGYADVVAHVVRRPADTTANFLYIVRSRGRLIEPTQGASPRAVRTVAQFATWHSASMDILGALTAVNDFACSGCGGTYLLIGHDQCGMRPSVPGLRTPTGPTSNAVPPYIDPATLEGPSASTFASQAFIGIDWAAVIGGAFVPDYTSLVNTSSWASYLLPGNTTITDVSGTGLLVVAGDVEFAGSYFEWRGAVVVGGYADFDADTTRVAGVLVTGIEQQITSPPPGGRWGETGTHLEVIYNSCYVQSAFASLRGLSPVPGSWMDNWASY
jgi:hypothetical protein